MTITVATAYRLRAGTQCITRERWGGDLRAGFDPAVSWRITASLLISQRSCFFICVAKRGICFDNWW
ncbi:MAG: hypothetical protein E6X17_08480 [Sporomusaceae bacterium]|nr:hypothetical protein [Sporomusaceae bacterium]